MGGYRSRQTGQTVNLLLRLRWCKSNSAHHFKDTYSNVILVVKRLRHFPSTEITRVRFPSEKMCLVLCSCRIVADCTRLVSERRKSSSVRIRPGAPYIAGCSRWLAYQPHKLDVEGSSPSPATRH